MQTFLPYPSFAESAAVLDRQRLGKQRIENLTIMRALLADGGYAHHPVTKQWAGHEASLMLYQNAICYEWRNVRGYKDTCLEKTLAIYAPFEVDREVAISRMFELVNHSDPEWLGWEEYHQSHRENLLAKNFEFYAPLFPDDEPNDEKVYPANEQ